ncbi:MAG TPA: MFS transporter [Limnobacter sp.]|nr:MFS transporter [Limnobacter sp.]
MTTTRSNKWLGLSVIALACMLYSMDLTVLNLAIPAISEDLQPSSAQLLWIVDIYGFMVAGALITMGTLGDRIGRRRLLMLGAAAFGVASVLAAFSTSAEMLIVTRALHGLAGATIAPSTLSLIRNMFDDPTERMKAIGIWISSFSIGAVMGPLVGGVLLEFFWWGSVFLINVPVMLLLLVLAPRLLPEYKDESAGRLDVPSAGLSLAGVLLVIYALKHTAESGAGVLGLGSLLAGLFLLVRFVRRQRHLKDPLIDLTLFKAPGFVPVLGTYLLSCLTMFGVYVYIAQYLQLVLGLSPLVAGAWTVPWALAFVVGTNITPWLAQRLGQARLVVMGLLGTAAGFAGLAVLGVQANMGLLVVATVVLALGLSPMFTLGTELIISSAPPERAGAASALAETGAEFGGAVGIAVFGSVGVAIYRSHMAQVLDTGWPADVQNAALDTLGGAVAIAGQLPAAQQADLLVAARDAFMQGMQFTSVVGVAVMLLATVLAHRSLRHIRHTSGQSH